MKKFFSNKKIIILSLCALIIGFFCVLRSILSYSTFENCFYAFTGLKISFDKPKTVIEPKLSIGFKANKIYIYDAKKLIKFVEINNPEVSFHPWSLLVNKVSFKKLNAQNILINIKRNENGEIDLLKASKIKDFDCFKNQNAIFAKIDSKINNITLVFEDNYKIKGVSKLVLDNSKISLSKKNKSLEINETGYIESKIDQKTDIVDININIKSKYPFKHIKEKDLKTDISLKGKDFYLLGDVFKKYVSKDISGFQGSYSITLNTIDSDFSQKLNLKIEKPTITFNHGKVITPYNEINAKGILKVHKETLFIESLNVNSNELNLALKGEIFKPLSKKPDVNIETEIKNTQLNGFLQFIPDNLIYYNPKGIPTLKKSDFHAVLDGKINAKLFPLDITGNLKASNVHIPNYPKPYMQNDVNAYFMKDKVRIYTRVYTPENEYVIVDGVSNLDDSLYGKYNVKSTNKIDLTYAQLYLVPVQQIIGFNLGPVPIMNITGFGNIDIKTQGTIEDAQIFGQFNAYGATAAIEGLDTKLTHGSCKLIFDNRNLIFKEIKGKIDNADFLLTGQGNTKGEVKLSTKINNIRTHNLLKIFNNSILSQPYKPLVKNIAAVSGNLSLDINLEGTIKDYENKEFFNDLTPSGTFNLKNNTVILNNKLKAKNISGALSFGQAQSALLDLFINNSKVNVDFSSKTPLTKISKGEKFDFKSRILSDRFEFKDLADELNKIYYDKKALLEVIKDIDFYTKFDIASQGGLSINNLDFGSVKNSGYIIGLNSLQNKNIKFNSGIIKVENDKLIFNNFDAMVLDGEVKAKGAIHHIFAKNPMGDLHFYLNDINLDKLNKYLPKIKITSSSIKDGHIYFRNNDIRLDALSIEYDGTPLFLNAQLKDIYKTNKLEADFSTIFNEAASDNIINPYLSYPIRIKGEIPVRGTFRGTSDDYDISFNASIPKDSDIYFSGANLGDTAHKKEINSKIRVTDNKAVVDNFTLVKYITNQNGKTNALQSLKANGEILISNNDLKYNNFKITTLNPINVRILNLVFKKSLLKQGNFECNINLNDSVKSPKIEGKVQLQDLDIPLYDTIVNNIKVDITKNFIEGIILAENKKSDMKIYFKGANKLTPPYMFNKVAILSNNLDVQDIIDSLDVSNNKSDISKNKDLEVKPDDIVVEHGSFEFKDVQYNKITAQNLKGTFNYKNNIFNLNDIILDIAGGKAEAEGSYSLNTTKLDLKAAMENCNANILTKEFLNLQGQLFGLMDGVIYLSAKHLNTPDGIKNVKSKVEFSINDGKMPKLGSLEYLLRAGNLIRSGIIGLSLNNLIQVLTPYKTGEFEKITGTLTIEKGEVNNLEIKSQGKNLSLYLSGNYSILENFASIKIYGKLSKNISNALGSIGNASLSQFINAIVPKKDKNKDAELLDNLAKIPSIEIENPEPRYFTVKVLGDINKENYIKSFNWE